MSTQAVLVGDRGRLATAVKCSAFGFVAGVGFDCSVVCAYTVKLRQQIASSKPLNLFVIMFLLFLKTLADCKNYRDTLRAIASAKLRQHSSQEVKLLRGKDHSKLRAYCEDAILVVSGERWNLRS